MSGARSRWKYERKTYQVMKRIKTIGEFHKFRQMPLPEHPLISVTEIDLVNQKVDTGSINRCYDFYAIGMKRVFFSKTFNFRYGMILSF